ncbi:MAG: cob(I)yrinic acid a,c-diamide adenosyltransferase [Candidatus Izemoplasmatales bacterium]|jgi:cob(I)alamin adenosyltransferase
MKSASISVISTKTGDKGYSSDYSGKRHKKNDKLFEVLGTIDELSSWIGICYQATKKAELRKIQTNLQTINSMIATSPEHPNYLKLTLLNATDVAWLEANEQTLLDKVDFKKAFILPGSDSSKEGAWFDLARAVARRAERRFFAYLNLTKRTDLDQCGSYLNRLSDLLFLMARAS